MTWVHAFIVNTSELWPEPCDIGAACMPTWCCSMRSTSASVVRHCAISPPWVSIAPLGRPVVPDV